MSFAERKKHVSEMFYAGLRRVDPYRMLMDHVRLEGDTLHIDLGETEQAVDLQDFDRVMVIGAGKATAPMARAMEHILGERLTGGVISVKYGHTEALDTVRLIEAGHPVPDASGMAAAQQILELADGCDERTLVISLISGGGSALLTMPWQGDGDFSLSLADKQKTTQLLLDCGADIEEINCIRKHLSMIKGGRLLARLAPATSVNFILSDVVGDRLSSIASGATCADPTTYEDAWGLVSKYGIEDELPDTVRRILAAGRRGDLPETVKEGDPVLSLSRNVLIGTNYQALGAAAAAAEHLGYRVIRLTSRIVGEAREVAKVLAAIAIDSAAQGTIGKPPVCIMSGGEPVVQIKGAGKGGRNQEMALAFLLEMQRHEELCRNMTFLAASTDGNDGPTDAAGAFADLSLRQRARSEGLKPQAYLENNDSYHFFEACDGLLRSGPTNTNVCDLHFILLDA